MVRGGWLEEKKLMRDDSSSRSLSRGKGLCPEEKTLEPDLALFRGRSRVGVTVQLYHPAPLWLCFTWAPSAGTVRSSYFQVVPESRGWELTAASHLLLSPTAEFSGEGEEKQPWLSPQDSGTTWKQGLWIDLAQSGGKLWAHCTSMAQSKWDCHTPLTQFLDLLLALSGCCGAISECQGYHSIPFLFNWALRFDHLHHISGHL